ncbi:MAG: hypothetical protein ABH852_04025 [Methanobacteriota archaeon]
MTLFDLLWIIVLTFLFGPIGSIPYSFSQGLSVIETAILVSAAHAAIVPIWFAILELIKYRLIYENRLIHKIASTAWTKSKRIRSGIKGNLQKFEKKVGQKRFGLGVVLFTFNFGVSWAVLSAILLNIKKSTIIMSIAIGAVVSSVFWSLVFGGIVGFLPDPLMLYFVSIVITLVILGYQKYRERKILREISKLIKKVS